MVEPHVVPLFASGGRAIPVRPRPEPAPRTTGFSGSRDAAQSPLDDAFARMGFLTEGANRARNTRAGEWPIESPADVSAADGCSRERSRRVPSRLMICGARLRLGWLN